MADKPPDRILAKHEARRSFRPDAVLDREFLAGRGGLEPPASRLTTQGPMPCGCEHSATELPAYHWHTAESNLEMSKIFISAYLRIVQIV